MPLIRLSYEEARRNSQNPATRWPESADERRARLTPFARPEFRPSFTISRDDLVFTIGSCFARNIENQMLIEGFNVASKQFKGICAEEGVEIAPSALNKFVVHSIFNELSWALDPATPYPSGLATEVGRERFLDMQLAPGLRPGSKASVLAKRRAVTRYMALAGKASVVVVTLGLVEAWYDRVLGLYLNFPPLKACAEREPTRYELHTLDYNEVVQAFEGIIELLRRFGQPGVRIMLTVSPVALSSTFTDADALVANCYSKSVQRAAAEYLYRTHDMVEYFPSYESVTLSDRSSAWLEDLAHASDEVVRLNVVRMMRAYTSGGAQPGGEAFDETALATALNLSKEAEALAAAGDIEAAERLFVEATGMAANEGIVFLRYGSFLFKLGRVRDADRVLARAVELDVGRFGAHFSLGQVKFHRGDFQSAEVQLRRAIELEPGRGGIAHLLARCVAKQGRHADAFELYRAAVLCAPANEVALREFIALVDSSVEADQAIELLTTLLDNPDASRVVPQLLLELKQHAALRSGPAELERQVA